jgi:hypothetical protein
MIEVRLVFYYEGNTLVRASSTRQSLYAVALTNVPVAGCNLKWGRRCAYSIRGVCSRRWHRGQSMAFQDSTSSIFPKFLNAGSKSTSGRVIVQPQSSCFRWRMLSSQSQRPGESLPNRDPHVSDGGC